MELNRKLIIIKQLFQEYYNMYISFKWMHNIVLRNSWLVAMQIWFGFQSNGMGLGHYCDTQVDQDIYQSLQSSKVKIKKNI